MNLFILQLFWTPKVEAARVALLAIDWRYDPDPHRVRCARAARRSIVEPPSLPRKRAVPLLPTALVLLAP